MRKWWYRRFLIIMVVFTMIMSTGFGMERLESEAEKSQVSRQSMENTMVIPGGMPIGIYMEMDGVLVLATESIKSIDGNKYEPAKNLVKTGDYIVGINGKEIENKNELVRVVNQLESPEVILRLRRTDEYIEVKMKSVEVTNDKYKLGIWVKDNIQGLGTITYINASHEFGALGHGIHDSDTDELIEISEGAVYETKIVGIQKGVKGEPGGLEGVIVYNRYNKVGTIEKNTDNGIFGVIDNIDALFETQEPIGVCRKKDIELGTATIRCSVDGTVGEYEIRIRNVDYYTADVNKGIIIEVTDEKLLKQTGGIVQGMSGSPILQNGKIIGAVTHVLVNDPARGYGIFIEDMLKD